MDFEKYESNSRIHQLQSFFNQKISEDNRKHGYNFAARNQSNASYSKSKTDVRKFYFSVYTATPLCCEEI